MGSSLLSLMISFSHGPRSSSGASDRFSALERVSEEEQISSGGLGYQKESKIC